MAEKLKLDLSLILLDVADEHDVCVGRLTRLIAAGRRLGKGTIGPRGRQRPLLPLLRPAAVQREQEIRLHSTRLASTMRSSPRRHE